MDSSGFNSCDCEDQGKDNKQTNESNNSSTDEFYNMGCCDIPEGFQGLDPQVFALIGEIVGNILSGRLPFNVQNAIGNWFQLIGQVILTYNAQQQYFQSGPGRYFLM